MYKRTEDLKALLSQIPSFNSAIYDDGILKDLRFEFLYQNETFLLHYKFDYSKPHLYHKKKDSILTPVKDFIVPKSIKQEIERITDMIRQFNQTYYPLIPSQQQTIGILTYESKYFNEYAPANKEIDYLSVTYDVREKEEVVAEVELAFKRTQSKWATDKIAIHTNLHGKNIEMNVCLFENSIVKMLNSLSGDPTRENPLLEEAEDFLKGTN